MSAFMRIGSAISKAYKEGKKAPPKETAPPRQQRRIEAATPPPVKKAPVNRDARLMGDTMGGMAGKAAGALKGRRQRIEDAVDEATGYKRGR